VLEVCEKVVLTRARDRLSQAVRFPARAQTIRIPDGAIDRKEEVEPVIQYSFGFNVKQPNGSPLLKTGVGTGTLKLSTPPVP
jgi:hypothetical protein